MTGERKKIDRFFLFSVAALTIVGFVIFLSASLGLLAQTGASFGSVALKQSVSLAIGIGVFWFFSRLQHSWLRKLAMLIFIGAVIINLALFIPGLSLNHGGASRWIDAGFVTFQPSEFLKIAFIIYCAAWAQFVKEKIKTLRFGLLPYLAMVLLLALLLLAQSDTDTLVIIAATGLVMFFIAGMKIRHVALAVAFMAIGVAGVVYFRPYALERVKTFLHLNDNKSGANYQINQSLIAIGSGQWTGRGFGQSVQKFGYVPEPIGDSVFAIAAEEFGFIGSVILLALYVLFGVSSFRIGLKSPDAFGGFLAIGIAVLIILESFMNIAAMLGLIPLPGLPLLFVSHGGTALIITLAAAGMVANVSKGGK